MTPTPTPAPAEPMVSIPLSMIIAAYTRSAQVAYNLQLLESGHAAVSLTPGHFSLTELRGPDGEVGYVGILMVAIPNHFVIPASSVLGGDGAAAAPPHIPVVTEPAVLLALQLDRLSVEQQREINDRLARLAAHEHWLQQQPLSANGADYDQDEDGSDCDGADS